ncbi:DUF1565 domain-containing protein [bacterium]|nr:DUF1565 domain-containing protein [bacterium]
MLSLMLCLGLLIQVPQTHQTITGAIDASSQGDTILVQPGTYSEQLRLPSHDIVLVSDFFLSGDSSALYNTIIDASDWIDEDTASTVVIINGSTRETIVSGFTITGGYGTLVGEEVTIGGGFYIRDSNSVISSNIISGNEANSSTAIYAYESNPVISGNHIYGNRGQYGPVGMSLCGSDDEPAIFEANDIAENPGFPDDPLFTMSPGFAAGYCNVIVRSNYFHDFAGCMGIAATFDYSEGELSGNIFENLDFRRCPGTSIDRGYIVRLYHSDVNISNNKFRNCSTTGGSCVEIVNAPSRIIPVNVVENEFDNILASSHGVGLLVNNSAATVSRNKFSNCGGEGGAVAISIWSEFPQCSVFVTENEFVENDYYEQAGMHQASAISIGTDGTGIAILRGNVFTNNQKIAVDLLWEGSDSYYMDAEQNFWGNPSGPYHPTLNPTGRGDTIAGRVDFDPWLIENDIDSDNRPSTPVPDGFMLLEPYPNPFNPGVMLPLSITRPGIFKIVVFDLLGRRIWEQTERLSGVGIHRIYWPGIDANGHLVAAGIYFARASSANQITSARKLVLLK